MKPELKDICRYMDFLIGDLGYFITLHGDFVAVPQLIRYNFHLNTYCKYVKSVCDNWQVCIEKQKRVFQKCGEGEFFGVCHAGVGEYVYPIIHNETVCGFVSVSGYKGKNEDVARGKALRFADKNNISGTELLKIRNAFLLSDIPGEDTVDAVIRPLVFMLEEYIAQTDDILYSDNGIYSRLLRFINSNHTDKLTMKLLSQRFNCSISTLSHLFKKNSGMSISEYVEKLRLDEAKWLLKQTAFSVTEISDSLGFCNSAYFSYVFKRSFGVSPKQYKANRAAGSAR